jgi:hypothetical protein
VIQSLIYGKLIATPIVFPDDIEVTIVPVRQSNKKRIGRGCFTVKQHVPWGLLRIMYELNGQLELRIKAGKPVTLFVGAISANLPESLHIPKHVAITMPRMQ